MEFLHHGQSIPYGTSALDGDRIIYHTVFGTLNGMYLTSLLGNRHVFVDNTDTALASNGNGKTSLGHRVHSGRNQWYIQCYVS